MSRKDFVAGYMAALKTADWVPYTINGYDGWEKWQVRGIQGYISYRKFFPEQNVWGYIEFPMTGPWAPTKARVYPGDIQWDSCGLPAYGSQSLLRLDCGTNNDAADAIEEFVRTMSGSQMSLF